jgi:hypothetical protein
MKKKEKSALRLDLEHCVWSFNKVLREAVQTMNNVNLLRNVHPMYREVYARRLKEEGEITEDQMRLFTTNKFIFNV